ncbi:SGNH/GDSL hydrolase family protein [Sulfuricystis thermophila]|uniref:SGNH/GDSL hydrolase family protein n=1 Tax=Sulfuricystis thermophila TaxID=2496847 RepID=UPI001559EDCB|nr:SGNH/GDSL hydrolase family protein [Sulfuricystis thermophila]
MKARSLFLGLCACGLFCSTPSQAASYSSLYIFGDSLADTGNNAWVFDNALPALDPTNSTGYAFQRTEAPISPGVDEVDTSLVPTFPYTSNRYSNGGVWPDYVSAITGLPTQNALNGVSFPDLYNFMMGGPAPTVTGTNFAFGGARVGTTPPLGFPFSLVDQVSAFVLLLNGNPAPADALFIVEGGGNDARDVLAATLDGDDSTDPATFIQAYIDGMNTIFQTLADIGAKHVAVWNVPDISLTPAVNSLLSIDPMAKLIAGGAVGTMNYELENLLGGYTSLFDDLILFDLHDVMANIVTNYSDYSLTNVSSACAVDPACVADPTGYLFWDGIHPTTYGHQLVATAFVNTMRMPEPATLWLMLIVLLPAALGRRLARS